MTKPTIDEQIAWLDRPHGVGNSLPDSYKASIRASLEELKRIREVHVPEEVDIGEMIFVWSMRPKPDTATGAAWENGARHGWAWRQKHIDILRDMLKRETEECQRQTRENFRLARLHEEAERQLATRKSNEMQKSISESYQVYVNR